MVNRWVAEQVFSYLGLVLWSFQLVPQVWKSYRRKSTDGVSPWTMLIWAISGSLLGNYNVGLNVAIPLQVQPQLFTFIAFICLAQELHYSYKWSVLKSWVAFIVTILLAGGFEVGMVFAFRAAQDNGVDKAITFFGVIPVITILIGFAPQYYTIFCDLKVEGISHIFLAMDFFGSVFSFIALAFRDNLDVLSLVNYAGIAVFDVGILILYYIFKWYNGNEGGRRKSRSTS
ncbi:PQ loop repeat-domain-containing protein, partial [Phycomyces nitens]